MRYIFWGEGERGGWGEGEWVDGWEGDGWDMDGKVKGSWNQDFFFWDMAEYWENMDACSY